MKKSLKGIRDIVSRHRDVDLVPKDSIRPELKERVLKEVVYL